MKNFTKLLIAFFLFGFATVMKAQETIPASGGNALGSGGSSSYTIGQILYSVDDASVGSVFKGVQVPYDFLSMGTDDFESISLQCILYPNPTNDFINLKVDDYKLDQLHFKLFDLTGKLLQEEQIAQNETKINMKDYNQGCYFLKVTDSTKAIKTFKIIKHN
jgi:hypothetical protein